jgi:hypothetical protein
MLEGAQLPGMGLRVVNCLTNPAPELGSNEGSAVNLHVVHIGDIREPQTNCCSASSFTLYLFAPELFIFPGGIELTRQAPREQPENANT